MAESRLWLLYMLSGVVLLGLLGAHMFLMHLPGLLNALGVSGGEPLAFEAVARRSQSPAWQIYYLVFLVVALYHGLYGLRSVLLEVFSAAKTGQHLLNLVLAAVGVLAFVYATYVVTGF